MPTIRLKNTAPNIGSRNTLPNIKLRNTAPNQIVKNDVVHQRISTMGSVTTILVPATSFGGAGFLIGMLGLTYTKVQNVPASTSTAVSDFKPNIRITNI